MSLNKFYMLLYPFTHIDSDYTPMHIFRFLAFTGVGKRAMLEQGKRVRVDSKRPSVTTFPLARAAWGEEVEKKRTRMRERCF